MSFSDIFRKTPSVVNSTSEIFGGNRPTIQPVILPKTLTRISPGISDEAQPIISSEIFRELPGWILPKNLLVIAPRILSVMSREFFFQKFVFHDFF